MGIIDTLIRENVLEIYHDYRTQTVQDLSGKGRHGVFGASANGKFSIAGFSSNDTPRLTIPVVFASPLSSVSFIALTNGIVRSIGVYPEIMYYNDAVPFEWNFAAALTYTAFGPKSYTASLANKQFIGVTHTNGSAVQGYIDGNYTGALAGGVYARTYASATIQIASYTGGNYQLTCPLKCFIMVSRVLTASEMSQIFAELQEKKFPTRTYSIRSVDSSPNPNEPGLVWAPDLQHPANDGTVTDLSPTSATATRVGVTEPSFSIDGIGAGRSFNGANGYTATGTSFTKVNDFTVSCVVKAFSFPISSHFLVGQQGRWYIRFYNTGSPLFRFETTGTSAATGFTPIAGQSYHLIVVFKSDSSVDFYVNGVFLNNVACLAAGAGSGSFNLGHYNGTAYSNCKIYRAEIYNRAFTASEVRSLFEKSGLKQIQTTSGFGTPVSTASRGGIAGGYLESTRFQFGSATPRYTVAVSTIQGETVKTIKCGTAGHLYQATDSHFTPQQAAWGTWEFSFNKTNAGVLDVMFVSNDKLAPGIVGCNGYVFEAHSSEEIMIYRMTGAGAINVIRTIAGYISASAWYTIRITRSFLGEFKMWIKGGIGSAKEYPNWTLVGTATDNTYTVSNYQVLDLDAADQVSIGSKEGDYAMTWSPF